MTKRKRKSEIKKIRDERERELDKGRSEKGDRKKILGRKIWSGVHTKKKY